jgi:hypothetical protein
VDEPAAAILRDHRISSTAWRDSSRLDPEPSAALFRFCVERPITGAMTTLEDMRQSWT